MKKIYKSNEKVSSSIKSITSNIFEYNNKNEMLEIIKNIIEKDNL